MNTVLETIKKRRSIRVYQTDQITNEELNKIIEAGLWAPCAGSRQAVKMVIVQDRHLNDQLGKINRDIFGPAIHPKKGVVNIANDSNIVSAFYKAPTVIYLFAPNTYPNAIQDCCVTAQNMMLEATEINIGSIFISRGEKTFESSLGKECMKKWGFDESYQCHSIIPLGYIKKSGIAQARKENRVIFD